MDEVKYLSSERKIDILCISETWLLEDIPDKFIQILNFNVFRHDKGRGGGTCIFVRDDLKVKQLCTGIENHPYIEDLWINVQYKKLPSFIIGCIYRHPHASVDSFNYLSDIFKYMCLQNKPIFILGDFNDDLFSAGNKLDKIFKNLKLRQLIDRPTRVTPNSKTLLDLAITNRPEMIVFSDVIPGTIADHDLISIIIDFEKPKRQPLIRTFRSLKNYTQNDFCNKLLKETSILDYLLLTDNVDTQVDIFTKVFIDCLNDSAPIVTREIKRPPSPWISNDIKEAINFRNRLQKELKGNRSNVPLQEQYRNEKKRVKSLIVKAKTNYYHGKFNSCRGDIKGTWKVIKDLIPNNKKNSGISGRVNEFNSFFSNVGKNTFEKSRVGAILDDNVLNFEAHSNQVDLDREPFKFHPVDCNTVILAIKHLKNTNSFGSDEISFRFIKDSLPVNIIYITIIINTSIVTYTFPDSWKLPHVIPLFKGGDEDDISNYRPISLLPVLSKILERIIADQLMIYLESNKLLSNTQHGFRPKLSTETALLKVSDAIYSNIENKKISLLLLLDLSKAFDSVNHNILLNKCINLNIDTNWLKSYLNNRYQLVRSGNNLSEKLPISFGVPQGSILGPILFSIYVNDMKEHFPDCLLVQYADDVQFLLNGNINEIPTLKNNAEIILKRAKAYFQKVGLLLNEKKTQCIFIGSRQYISRLPEDIGITFNEKILVPSKQVKNLGVYFDNFMTFSIHIEEMSKKVNGLLFYLNRIKDQLDDSARKIVIQSLVLTIINYCSTIWGTTNKTLIEKVQRLQNFAVRIALGNLRKFDHVSPAFEKLHWLRIKDKIYYDICLLVFKSINNYFPDWFYKLPTVAQVRNTQTRQCVDLFIPRTTTLQGSRLFSVGGPLSWNKLPEQIKGANNLLNFKCKLRNFLLTK